VVAVKVSRSLVINTLCCAIGIALAYNIPWWIEAWRVLPPFFEEIFRCLQNVQR
jgi:hypothetical protein